jgi:hypothetical protein
MREKKRGSFHRAQLEDNGEHASCRARCENRGRTRENETREKEREIKLNYKFGDVILKNLGDATLNSFALR